MDFTTTIGTLGASIILIAFILNQMNKWKNDDLLYDFSNFLGSTLLVIYSILLASFPFLILNLVWAGFSAKDVIKKLLNEPENTNSRKRH